MGNLLSTFGATLYLLHYVNAIHLTQTQQSVQQSAITTEQKAQWGFLKNIVNIDTFFASGAKSEKQSTVQLPKEDKKLVQKKAEKKVESEMPEEQEADNDQDVEQEQVQLKVKKAKTIVKVLEKKEEPVQKEEPKKAAEPSKAVSLASTDADSEQAKKEAHFAQVRNEGLEHVNRSEEEKKNEEIDLEIEAPGAANKVAEEGAKTIQTIDEYNEQIKKLTIARAKPENKIGEGGQYIELKKPNDYADTMRILVLHDTATEEKNLKMEKFETKNPTQAKTAAMAMQMTLETNLGATIIDDGQPGRESLISNFATDQSKTTSQIVTGYAIRNSLSQKMAPGDQMFYIISYENKVNKMNSFKTRALADQDFTKMNKETPRIMISGETGDILQGQGSQNWKDQCLGMFLNQRYQGKYYGQS